jgi:hypothetical protein
LSLTGWNDHAGEWHPEVLGTQHDRAFELPGLGQRDRPDVGDRLVAVEVHVLGDSTIALGRDLEPIGERRDRREHEVAVAVARCWPREALGAELRHEAQVTFGTSLLSPRTRPRSSTPRWKRTSTSRRSPGVSLPRPVASVAKPVLDEAQERRVADRQVGELVAPLGVARDLLVDSTRDGRSATSRSVDLRAGTGGSVRGPACSRPA